MVSIILSSYNGEKYIREQILSIVSQSYIDWKLHVFDDCSTDDTEKIVKEYCEKYPKRIFWHPSEKNHGSTFNFLNGVRELSGTSDYYMFCDQDDVWLNDKIEITLKFLKKLENKRPKNTPALVFTDAILVDEKLDYINNSFFKTAKLKSHKTDLPHLLMENKCIGCTCMFNDRLASILNDQFENIRYHDWWMALLAASFGKVRVLKIPTLLYRQHGNNQVGQVEFKSYVASRNGRKAEMQERLEKTYSQAESLYKAYYDKLNARKKKQISRFVFIRNARFFQKRFIVLRYRYLKSGFIRNMGLMLYL